MNVLMHSDTLGVIFKFVPTADLTVCAAVCRLWCVVSQHERRERARRLASVAFRWLDCNPGHLVLAGSMALWIASGEPTHWFPNDADLFSFGPAAPPSAAPEVAGMRLAERKISCDGQSYSYLSLANNASADESGPRPLIVCHDTGCGPLQFILSSYFPTPASVVDSFDLSCTMVGYTARGVCIRGAQFSMPQFTAFYWQGVPRIREEGKLTAFQSLRTRRRAQKYSARGYEQMPDGNATREQMRFAQLYALTKCSTFRSMLETGAPVTCQCTHPKKACYFESSFSGSALADPRGFFFNI